MSKIKQYFKDNHFGSITQEKGHSEKKNSFSINSEETFSKIILEHGVLKGLSAMKCECFFLRESNEETYFVELKGRSANVKKGIEQIMSSIIEVNKLIPIESSKVNGFVIGSSTPKALERKTQLIF